MRVKTILSLLLFLFFASSGFSTEAKVTYGEGTVQFPRFRSWDGSSWAAESSAVSVGGTVRWTVLRSCPLRNEMVLGTLDPNGSIDVQVWDGNSWGNLVEVTPSASSSDKRVFDIAYEGSTGEALIVYQNNTSDPRYRIWNGVSWSSEGIVDLSGTGVPNWIALTSRPNSDEIVLIEVDDASNIYAAVWNGSSWGNEATFSGSISVLDHEGIAVAYEQVSNDAMAAYCPTVKNIFKYRIWNGTTWGSELDSPSLSGNNFIREIQLASDPSSDQIVAGVASDKSGGTVYLNLWSGSAWGSFLKATASLSYAANRRAWDVAYEQSGNQALVAYSKNAINTIAYRTYDDTVWSAEQTGPDMGNPIQIVQLVSDPNSDNIFLGTLTNDHDLQLTQWADSSFASPFEAELGMSDTLYKPFSIEYNRWTPSADTSSMTNTSRNEADGNITTTWTTQVGREYDVFYADSLEGNYTDVSDVVATDTVTSWTDDGTETPSHPDSVTERFYRVEEQEGNTSSNTEGKFTITLQDSAMSLVSIPFVVNDSAIGTVVGTQLIGASSELDADRIWKWNPATRTYQIAWLVSGGPYDGEWWDPDTDTVSTMTLSADEGFWIQNRHGTQPVTFVGKVSDISDRTISLETGMQLIGSAYPVEVRLDSSDLWEDGATGNINELDADRVWEWDPIAGEYKFAWLIEGAGPSYDGTWWDSSTGAETTIKLKPGVGYWFEIRDLLGHADFTWTYPKPYSQPPN